MSFTNQVKNEVSKLELEEIEKISFLSAIVQNEEKDYSKIKIITENESVARKCFDLFKELYNITPIITVRKGYNYSKNYIYILEISSKIVNILNNLGIEFNKKILNIPMSYVYDDVDLKKSYLKGLFLICGSINDPKLSRYHLEFTVSNEEYAVFIKDLLNTFYLNSKITQKNNKYMVYVKEAEKIGDFLRILDSRNALFYYEDIRIYRDHKNMTNRLNNCEQANVDKTIMASNEIIKDIELLEQNGAIELLDDKEKMVVEYRKKYPDSSLLELSEIISMETGTSITKSGLHHRIDKIKKMAEKFKSKI